MPEEFNKLYQNLGKCDDKQQYKAMIEAAMVPTYEGCTNNSPIKYNPFMSTKEPSAIKTTP